MCFSHLEVTKNISEIDIMLKIEKVTAVGSSDASAYDYGVSGVHLFVLFRNRIIKIQTLYCLNNINYIFLYLNTNLLDV